MLEYDIKRLNLFPSNKSYKGVPFQPLFNYQIDHILRSTAPMTMIFAPYESPRASLSFKPIIKAIYDVHSNRLNSRGGWSAGNKLKLRAN